jgi:thioester reductase-like protein
MTADKTLITGAGGYVGMRTAKRLLDTSNGGVILWLHAADDAEAGAKVKALAPAFEGYGARVEYRWGELGAGAPFASVDPASVRAIVHGAAVTRFNVDEATAQRVNIDGAERVFQFAERCPSLEHLTYVSTVYASGLATGEVRESALPSDAGFANHYERSKWTSEQMLASRFDHLPWRIARVATVIADDESGNVTQQNAVHNTLKLFFYGLLSLVPGKKDTPLYFVTGDFVAGALAELVLQSEAKSIYNVVHRRDETLTLDELVTLAWSVFEANDSFRSRRVLKPLYADAESFDILVDGIESFGGDVFKQALGSVAPFARQLFVHKDFKNDRLASRLGAYRAPDPRALATSTCEYLVRTRWGKA